MLQNENWPTDAFAAEANVRAVPQPGGFSDLSGVVQRYWKPLVIWICACVTLALLYVATTPAEFQASSSVMLEPRRWYTSSTQNSFANSTALDSSQVESHVLLVKSDEVLRRVFDERGLKNDPEYNNGPGAIRLLWNWLTNTSNDVSKPEEEKAFASFANNVTVRRAGQSYVLEIGFRSRSAERAASIANSIAASYILNQTAASKFMMRANGTLLQSRMDAINAQEEALLKQIRDGEISTVPVSDSDAHMVGSATTPMGKSFPKTGLTILASFVFALLTGLVAISVRHGLDRTVRSRKQITEELNLDCLAVVPEIGNSDGVFDIGALLARIRKEGVFNRPKKITWTAFANMVRVKVDSIRQNISWARVAAMAERRTKTPFPIQRLLVPGADKSPDMTLFSESMKTLRMATIGAETGKRPKVIGIVSCLPGEGKSVIAGKLVSELTLASRRAILVDADFRQRTLTRVIAPFSKSGLTDLLAQAGQGTGQGSGQGTGQGGGQAGAQAGAVKSVGKFPGPSLGTFLPAAGRGQAIDPNVFLGSDNMRSVLDSFSSWDYVVIDLPALSVSADMAGIGPLLDSVILIVEAGRCDIEDLNETIEMFARSDVAILGVVLNKAQVKRRSGAAVLRWGAKLQP